MLVEKGSGSDDNLWIAAAVVVPVAVLLVLLVIVAGVAVAMILKRMTTNELGRVNFDGSDVDDASI